MREIPADIGDDFTKKPMEFIGPKRKLPDDGKELPVDKPGWRKLGFQGKHPPIKWALSSRWSNAPECEPCKDDGLAIIYSINPIEPFEGMVHAWQMGDHRSATAPAGDETRGAILPDLDNLSWATTVTNHTGERRDVWYLLRIWLGDELCIERKIKLKKDGWPTDLNPGTTPGNADQRRQ